MSNNCEILQGDCLEVLKGMPDCSVDSIVTDPPYGLSFMGKKWEDGKLQVLFWQNWDWKCSLYERTLKHKEGFEPPVKLWFPSDIGKHKRFLKEITAERVVTPKRGKPLWSKIQHRENDLGDCVLEMMVYLDFRRGMISPKRKTSLAALPTGRAGW